MSQGRGIHLFPVEGTPSSLFTAEIMDCVRQVLTGPHNKLSTGRQSS